MRTSSDIGNQERQIDWTKTESGTDNSSRGLGQLPLTGELAIVGSGPGGINLLTPAAQVKIAAADIVIGYETYLKLISEMLVEKNFLSYQMTQEVERAKAAIAYVKQGLKVVVISGGDPGVYGMAGPLLELAAADGIKVEVIPGITAATAAASLLGAPLMHDFAVISLSDRLTPWQKIYKRLKLAAEADLVLVIYNPRSKTRTTLINQARNIILEFRSLQTPVGIVSGAFRADETVIISDLQHFLDFNIDMNTTLIVGNSQTKIVGGRMITPRGYQL
jgi:precorrin-3B C17-methyltransferase